MGGHQARLNTCARISHLHGCDNNDIRRGVQRSTARVAMVLRKPTVLTRQMTTQQRQYEQTKSLFVPRTANPWSRALTQKLLARSDSTQQGHFPLNGSAYPTKQWELSTGYARSNQPRMWKPPEPQSTWSVSGSGPADKSRSTDGLGRPDRTFFEHG